MQEYMLIYQGGDPEWHEKMTEEENQAVMQKWEAWMTALSEKGQLVSGGNPLHYSGKRLTPDHVVTDISAAEYHELVSGYSIIAAASMDEAVVLAKQCPILLYPEVTVEIREIFNIEM
ncbi:YciI family protein [Alteromonas flava]|uniref:YciI family protein n=1 Tax=Alteromonas flava TaxID=2048003 RepID=UPI000C28C558|nr:YciI family protein [Alteromonas flava]